MSVLRSVCFIGPVFDLKKHFQNMQSLVDWFVFFVLTISLYPLKCLIFQFCKVFLANTFLVDSNTSMCSSLITSLTHLSPVFWSFGGLGIALKDKPILSEHKNFLLALNPFGHLIWSFNKIKDRSDNTDSSLKFYMQASAPKMAIHGCKSWQLIGTKKKGQKSGCYYIFFLIWLKMFWNRTT